MGVSRGQNDNLPFNMVVETVNRRTRGRGRRFTERLPLAVRNRPVLKIATVKRERPTKGIGGPFLSFEGLCVVDGLSC